MFALDSPGISGFSAEIRGSRHKTGHKRERFELFLQPDRRILRSTMVADLKVDTGAAVSSGT